MLTSLMNTSLIPKILLLLSLSLGGCTPPTLSPCASTQIRCVHSGKLSFKYTTSQMDSIRFNLSFSPHVQELQVFNAFGMTLGTYLYNKHLPRPLIQKSGIFTELAKLHIPIEALPYWLQGIPVPFWPIHPLRSFEFKPAEHVSSFIQRGWTIALHSSNAKPKKVSLSSGFLSIRVVFHQTQCNPPS